MTQKQFMDLGFSPLQALFLTEQQYFTLEELENIYYACSFEPEETLSKWDKRENNKHDSN